MPLPLFVLPAVGAAAGDQLYNGGRLRRAAMGALQRGAQGYAGAARAVGNHLFNPNPSPTMEERRGLTSPKPPMPGLPPSARVVTQYPKGVPTGVGGGNAAASRSAGGQGARKPPVPAPAAQVIAPVNTAITGNFSGERRASVAAQNAAQGASREPFWQANPAMAQAAMDAGRAAAAARGDVIGDDGMISKIGGGYLSSGSGLPATSDPSQQAYWERADIQAWAGANKGLADALKRKHGYTGPAPVGTNFDPNARTGLEFDPAARNYSVDPSAPEPPSLAASLQASPPAPAGFDPSSTVFEPQRRPVGVPESFNPAATAFSAPAAPVGTDPAQRVAPAQMPTTGDTAVDPAQSLNREFLDSIKASWVPEEDELSDPAYFQPNTAYTQPAWPQGWF